MSRIWIKDKARCAECGRVFDLWNDDDANEWHHGHDCEPTDDDEPAAVV